MNDDFDFDFGSAFNNLARELKKGLKEISKAFSEEGEARTYGEKGRGFADGFGNFDFNLDINDFGLPRHQSYKLEDGSLVYRFMLPGFDENGIDLSFKGDMMILKARLAPELKEGIPNGPRRFFAKDIDRKEYRVPAEQYNQGASKAVYRNGILTVTIPPKEEDDTYTIKVDISKDNE
ncbi:hypothetical protein MASR2M29_01790 [Spirochaetota bacterium]